MEFSEYQKTSRETAVYPDSGNNFIYLTLGLADEAGEVAGKIKKLMRDQQKFTPADIEAVDRVELSKELGDVLWYISQLATELGIELEAIAEQNLTKLQSRQSRGVLHGSGDNR